MRSILRWRYWSTFILALVATLGVPVAVRADASPEVRKDWQPQVIYLVLTDRFANGDQGNDNAGEPDRFDPKNPAKFHGGDLKGLTKKLKYIDDLGATAI